MAINISQINENFNNIIKAIDKMFNTDGNTTLTYKDTDGSSVTFAVENILELKKHLTGMLGSYTELNDGDVIESNKAYMYTGGSIKINLPESPNNGDMVFVIDTTGNAALEPLTISAKQKINNSDDDLICDNDGFNLGLIYNSDNNNWSIIS